MDLRLTEEQKALQQSARQVLAAECPASLVREMEADERGFPTKLWKRMADLGWHGLPLLQQSGGSGLAFLDLALLIEEMGRALVPGPFIDTVAMAGVALARDAPARLADAVLPRIARGEAVVSMALYEESALYGADGIALRAEKRGDVFVLNGKKLFVNFAHVANHLMCVARSRPGAGPEAGVTCLLVDSGAPGLTLRRLRTLAADQQFEAAFADVCVPVNQAIGPVDQGWPVARRMIERGTVALCAYMTGAAHRIVDFSTAYAKQRVQFGRPIGAFQAVQHRLAEALADVEGMRYLTYKAAWAVDQPESAALEVAVAKAYASDAIRRIAAHGHQVHGAIGFSEEHDMPLFSRRAKTWEVQLGDATHYRETVARNIGL